MSWTCEWNWRCWCLGVSWQPMIRFAKKERLAYTAVWIFLPLVVVRLETAGKPSPVKELWP